MSRSARAILAALALGGCYTYQPASLAPSLVGRPVRFTVAEAGASNSLGAGAVYVDGRVLSMTDSSVLVAAEDVGRASGVEDPWHGNQLSLPTASIHSVSLRKLDRGRSLGVGAAVVGGAAAVALAIGGAGSSSSSTHTGTGAGK